MMGGGQAPPPPQHIGPTTAPGPNQGSQVQAFAKITNALKEIQEAMTAVPMGSELHTELLTTIQKLSKAVQNQKADPQMQLQELVKSIREHAQGNPMATLNRAMPPNQPPAMPPPGGAPPQSMAA